MGGQVRGGAALEEGWLGLGLWKGGKRALWEGLGEVMSNF